MFCLAFFYHFTLFYITLESERVRVCDHAQFLPNHAAGHNFYHHAGGIPWNSLESACRQAPFRKLSGVCLVLAAAIVIREGSFPMAWYGIVWYGIIWYGPSYGERRSCSAGPCT